MVAGGRLPRRFWGVSSSRRQTCVNTVEMKAASYGGRQPADAPPKENTKYALRYMYAHLDTTFSSVVLFRLANQKGKPLDL